MSSAPFQPAAQAPIGHAAHPRAHFDALYAQSDDPWRLRRSWYEARKRAVLLASLPAPRYASAYEPACAAGDLTACLAPRCDALLATDGSARAVDQARQRFASQPQVRVAQAWLPEAWPAGQFDLIVLSEFLYYLDAAALDQVITHAWEARTQGAVLVACHWRAPIEGCIMAGDALHDYLHRRLGLPKAAHYQDADFVLDVWQEGTPSPAQAERRR